MIEYSMHEAKRDVGHYLKVISQSVGVRDGDLLIRLGCSPNVREWQVKQPNPYIGYQCSLLS